jgi:uncharacterized BrkB/YihY/UPF0761 family membrane protein
MGLEIKVVTVIIGALFLVIALAWVDTLEVISSYVFFSEDKNLMHQEHIYRSRLFATLFATLLSLAIIAIIFDMYHGYNADWENE